MNKAQKIVDRLLEIYRYPIWEDDDPFRTLIKTVLSQHTNSKNTDIAFQNLFSRFKTIEEIANADIDELTDLIRPAGLHNIKARRIKDISKLIMTRYGGDINRVIQKGMDEARKELLDIDGIGPKTADCVLLFAGGYAVLPVDTHIFRVTKRLGLVPIHVDHEEVKKVLERQISPDKIGPAHIALISFGREFCRARTPRCGKCPLDDLCESKDSF
ncbi:MAG: endonuclease III [Methanosarcinales archaeon Met12]|nr:MAG: endonuclease III [Methanosarcinales archaeon Met12]